MENSPSDKALHERIVAAMKTVPEEQGLGRASELIGMCQHSRAARFLECAAMELKGKSMENARMELFYIAAELHMVSDHRLKAGLAEKCRNAASRIRDTLAGKAVEPARIKA